jgi:hypothetical protein
MPEKFDIRVVATDGTSHKKLLWVKNTTKHISYGFDYPMNAGHFTYHLDGKQHFRSDDENRTTFKMADKIPLKTFTGRVQVGGMGITRDSINLHSDFTYQKCESVVYIDTRTIDPGKNIVNIDLQFVEKDRLDLIYFFPDAKIIHIFRSGNPMIVISVW